MVLLRFECLSMNKTKGNKKKTLSVCGVKLLSENTNEYTFLMSVNTNAIRTGKSGHDCIEILLVTDI